MWLLRGLESGVCGGDCPQFCGRTAADIIWLSLIICYFTNGFVVIYDGMWNRGPASGCKLDARRRRMACIGSFAKLEL